MDPVLDGKSSQGVSGDGAIALLRHAAVLTLLAGAPTRATAGDHPSVTLLPAEVLASAGLPDDPDSVAAARSLPELWAPEPNVANPAPPAPGQPDDWWVAVHVFAGGNESAFAHASAPILKQALEPAVKDARRSAAIFGSRAEHVAVFLGRRKITLDERSLPYSDWNDPISRGRAGFLCFDGREIRDAISPFHAMRRNEVRFRPLLGETNPATEWHVYTGRQFLLHFPAASHAGASSVTEVLRGKPFVPLSQITRQEVESMAREAAGWLLRNVDAEGRLPYLILPFAAGAEPAATPNNELRQWMATRALIEAARREGTDAALATARRNVEYNLQTFYRDEDDYGVIERAGQVKLGAAALAALALREFPNPPAAWREKEERLERLVSFLWRNDGSFRCFLRPAERAHDNQNFYSGEALLYWARRLAAGSDPALWNRYRRSTDYYRSWHRRHRNPAFVPWHTLAVAAAWPLTREHPGTGWVFEMNDWLLTIQQPDGAAGHPDTAGRFYAPGQDFGPPHASSTGVYLEGLAAALRLARLTGDTKRSQSYAHAIQLGLRNARQLQFSGPADWLGWPENVRPLVAGGFRTTEYDATLRCDNVQHLVQACWAALDFPNDAGLFATPPR
jgi:hypothetical protein